MKIDSGELTFFGSREAQIFTREIKDSIHGVLKKNFQYGPDESHRGFVTASIDGRPCHNHMWSRDAGTFLRELVFWGYFEHAKLLAKNLIYLVRKNEQGYYTYPMYFLDGQPGTGSEMDGTAAVIIGMVLLWQRLPTDDPVRDQIYRFLVQNASPVNHIANVLKRHLMIPGSGEFGGGCGIAGEYYNSIQNYLAYLALRSVANLHIESQNPMMNESVMRCAVKILSNMEVYLIDSDETWTFCIDPATRKKDPAVVDHPINRGFGGKNGIACMYSDVLGMEPLMDSWRGIRVNLNTFNELYKALLRKRQFEKYGIWTQFDEHCHGLLTSMSYGQGYALQTMLLYDLPDMATKALSYMIKATRTPPPFYRVDRDSEFHFYERYYSIDYEPLAVPEQGCGALNLVNVSEPLKVARLLAGIDDASPDILKIIPRIPETWKGFHAINWPVRLGKEVIRVDIDYQRIQDEKVLSIKTKNGKVIPCVEIRTPSETGESGAYTRQTFRNVSDARFFLK